MRGLVAAVKAQEVRAGVAFAAGLLGVFWLLAGATLWAGTTDARDGDPLLGLVPMLEPFFAIAILSGALIAYVAAPRRAEENARDCIWAGVLSGVWIFLVFSLVTSAPSRWVTRLLDVPLALVGLVLLVFIGALGGLLVGSVGSMGAVVLTPLRRCCPRVALAVIIVACTGFAVWSWLSGERLRDVSERAVSTSAELEPIINKRLMPLPRDHRWRANGLFLTSPRVTYVSADVPHGRVSIWYPPTAPGQPTVSLQVWSEDPGTAMTKAEAISLLEKLNVRERMIRRIKPAAPPGAWLAEDGNFRVYIAGHLD